MNRIILISVAFMLVAAHAIAQTAIHDATITGPATDPDPSAVFDAKSTNKGMMVPRVSLTGFNDAATVPTPATSLLVYNTSSSGGLTPGYYYNSGNSGSPVWTRLMSGNTTPLTGNGAVNKVAFWTSGTDLSQDNLLHWNNTDKRLGVGEAAPSATLDVVGGFELTGEGNAVNLYHPTSGGGLVMRFHSRVNQGSDLGFIALQDETSNSPGSGGEDLRMTIGVHNDFRQSAAHSDELWLQGGGRLVYNTGSWDSELNTLIGTPGVGTTGGHEWRVNNTMRMLLDHSGHLGIGTAPQQALHVIGNVRVSSLDDDADRIVMADADGDLFTSPSLVGTGLGDNLGNHTATATLDMAGNIVDNASSFRVNHGSGNVLEVGNDAWLADVNMSNVVGVAGQQNAAHGGMRLGSTAYLYSNGSANIGIGTTTPGQKLQIETPLTVDRSGISFRRTGESDWANIYLENYGTSGTASNSNRLVIESADDGDADYILFRHDHTSADRDNLEIRYNYVRALQNLYVDGNVGIGTGASAAQKLHVAGTGRFTSLASADRLVYATSSGDLAVSTSDINPNSLLDGAGTLNYIPKWTPDGNTLGNSLLFDNGTNVGLGTVSPTVKLHMVSNGSTYTSPEDNNVAGIMLRNTNNSSANAHSILALRTGGASGGNPFVSFDVAGVTGWSIGQDRADGNKLKFANAWSSVATNTRMTVQTDGNVGINTTAPATRLHVADGYPILAGNDGMLKVKSIANTGSGGCCGTETVLLQTSIDNRADDYTISGHGGDVRHILALQQEGGRVAIGSVSAAYKLDVNGNTQIQGGLYTQGTASTLYGANASIYANNANASGGGIMVSDDGGFVDYNDGPVTFVGSTGLRIAGNSGASSSNAYLRVNGLAGGGSNKPVYADNNGTLVTDDRNWRLVAFDDFEGGTDGWVAQTMGATGNNGITRETTGIHGYSYWVRPTNGNDRALKKYYNLSGISFTEIRVELTYYFLDSWDNENAWMAVGATESFGAGSWASPIWNFRWDHDMGDPRPSTNVSFWGNTGWSDGVQTAIGQCRNTFGSGFWLFVGSSLDSGTGDETFSIDNVRIYVR